MKGIKLSINDIKISNSFDMVKLVIKLIATTKMLKLSETELHVLTHFVTNGYSKMTRESLIEAKLLKNKESVSNIIYAFRKYGIIVKNNLGEELHQDFKIPADLDAIKIEMIIKK